MSLGFFENDEAENAPPIEQGDESQSDDQSTWGEIEQLALVADGVKSGAPGAQVVQAGLGDMLTPAIAATFGILAPNWGVTNEESAALGEAWGSCIEIWFPDAQLSPKYAALGTALLTTAMVVSPRLSIPKKIEKEVKEGEQ